MHDDRHCADARVHHHFLRHQGPPRHHEHGAAQDMGGERVKFRGDARTDKIELRVFYCNGHARSNISDLKLCGGFLANSFEVERS